MHTAFRDGIRFIRQNMSFNVYSNWEQERHIKAGRSSRPRARRLWQRLHIYLVVFKFISAINVILSSHDRDGIRSLSKVTQSFKLNINLFFSKYLNTRNQELSWNLIGVWAFKHEDNAHLNIHTCILIFSKLSPLVSPKGCNTAGMTNRESLLAFILIKKKTDVVSSGKDDFMMIDWLLGAPVWNIIE